MAVHAPAAIAQAARLEAQANEHKKLAEYHRREAARARRKHEAFVRDCEASGITVIIERTPMPEGGTSGDDYEEQEAVRDR